MAKPNQLQIELPYAALPTLAVRETVRKNSVMGKQTYHINVLIVTVRELFNVRTKPEEMSMADWYKELQIEELAMDILANGQQEPIKGDMSADGKKFFLTDGYRRYLAVRWLLEHGYNTQKNGKSMDLIEATINPSGTTELDRVLIMLSSDKKLPYKDIEMAEGILRLHKVFGLSRADIKDRMGNSRQWVDNMIRLAEEPASIKEAIKTGTLTATAALTLGNTEKDPGKREEIVAAAKSEGRVLKVKDVSEEDAKKTAEEFNDPMHQSKEFIPGGFSALPSQSTKTETKQALDAEMESHKTDSKFKESRPKSDRDDALAKIDFKKEKTEAEMALNEVKGMLDKMHVMAGTLPDHQKGMRDDFQRMCAICVRKVEESQEIIKKAADER